MLLRWLLYQETAICICAVNGRRRANVPLGGNAAAGRGSCDDLSRRLSWISLGLQKITSRLGTEAGPNIELSQSLLERIS